MARQLAGPDADLFDVLNESIANEHVPYLAQLRYKGEGLLKRAQWEQTWEMQRAEDRTGERLDIPVPPKYKNTDFQKPSYWRNRGKLDVPKERFISYPYASPDSDDSLLLGWAGWDHREQAHALTALIEERASHRRLGRPPSHPADRRPGRGHALGPPVAQRDRPHLRPVPSRRLRCLSNQPTRKLRPNRPGPRVLDTTPNHPSPPSQWLMEVPLGRQALPPSLTFLDKLILKV